MKIYTKTGDNGETSLYGGRRISKANLQIDAYGTIDELNSWIGLINCFQELKEFKLFLSEIQVFLFNIGSHLAADPDKPNLKKPILKADLVTLLEKTIDNTDKQLPPLNHFILPGGSIEVSQIHITRTVCRRAERLIVLLSQKIEIPEIIIKFINRLSDFLFILARYASKQQNIGEIKWMP